MHLTCALNRYITIKLLNFFSKNIGMKFITTDILYLFLLKEGTGALIDCRRGGWRAVQKKRKIIFALCGIEPFLIF